MKADKWQGLPGRWRSAFRLPELIRRIPAFALKTHADCVVAARNLGRGVAG